MRTMFMTAALFAATSLSTAFAADLRMSWWGSDDRHVATQQALKVCGAKFGHTIAPEFTGQFVPNVGSNPAIARGAAAAGRAGGSAPSAQPAAAAPGQQQANDAAMQAALADLQVLQAKSQELQPVPAPRAKAKPADPAPESFVKTEPADAKVSGFEMQTLADLSPAQKTVGTLALLALAAGLVGAGYIGRRKKLKKLNGMLD